MRNVRVGGPRISTEGKSAVMRCLEEGRISEGKVTRRLEDEIARAFGAADAVAVNSGNSALFLSYVAAREIHKKKYLVTTALTFAATVSSALNAGLIVSCCDVGDDLLVNPLQAEAEIRKLGAHQVVYTPVHLFGYPCKPVSGATFMVQDSCEAVGTELSGKPVGLPNIACLSFYTSHVGGCGEIGVAVCADQKDADFIRSMKDQGREIRRDPHHVEKMTPTPFSKRYAHARVGWNFRTTDIQAALALDSWKNLPAITATRREIVRNFNESIKKYEPKVKSLAPGLPGISHLAYPILCETVQLRDLLVRNLEARGIETRPLLSVIPKEQAFWSKVKSPNGIEMADYLHKRGFYMSCHESIITPDYAAIGEVFETTLKSGKKS